MNISIQSFRQLQGSKDSVLRADKPGTGKDAGVHVSGGTWCGKVANFFRSFASAISSRYSGDRANRAAQAYTHFKLALAKQTGNEQKASDILARVIRERPQEQAGPALNMRDLRRALEIGDIERPVDPTVPKATVLMRNMLVAGGGPNASLRAEAACAFVNEFFKADGPAMPSLVDADNIIKDAMALRKKELMSDGATEQEAKAQVDSELRCLYWTSAGGGGGELMQMAKVSVAFESIPDAVDESGALQGEPNQGIEYPKDGEDEVIEDKPKKLASSVLMPLMGALERLADPSTNDREYLNENSGPFAASLAGPPNLKRRFDVYLKSKEGVSPETYQAMQKHGLLKSDAELQAQYKNSVEDKAARKV